MKTTQTMIHLVNDNNLRVQFAGKDGDIIGLCFDGEAQPALNELTELARELDRAGSEEDVRCRLLPGLTKRELVGATFATFGESNVYRRLRKYMHVARAFPAAASSSAQCVRRRTDVA